MSRLQRELEADFERLASNGYCADPAALAREGLQLLTPPERISTTDCASRHRLVPNAEGGARLWSPTLTPYVNGLQDSIDDPAVRVTVVVGPGRTGKTLAPENALVKKLKYGPMTDVLWYLPGALIDDYLDTTVSPLFELHPDLAAKLGPRPTDRKRNLKKIGSKFIRYFAANAANIAGKQAPFIVGDEIDLYPKRIRANFRQQLAIRQRAYGSLGKGYLCSHPDAGWTDGIAAAWLESTRGVWFWPCPHCEGWSSPCPTADWRMTLDYERPKGMAGEELLDHVEQTTCMICPHCGVAVTNDDKPQMLSLGKWVHDGQIIGVDGTITGRTTSNDTHGFWIHGTMSPFVSWGKLAREYVGALVFFESSRNATRLKEVTAKSLGEVYVGAGAAGKAMDAARMKRRAKEADAADEDARHRLGTVPAWVLYLTAAVDVGGNKFDVMVRGWGHNGESCIVDRFTIVGDAAGNRISPPKVQTHWLLLRSQVIDRRYPIAGRPGWFLPVASTGLDTGGAPGSTWKAYEFARQMKIGPCAGKNGYKLRLFKGSSNVKAPEIGDGTEVNRDDQGKPTAPTVTLYVLGVHKLKEVTAENMAIDAPGPGYLHLPVHMDPQHIEEMTNASLIDDKWVERKPNETWDLLVYTDAVRQLLKPDRPRIKWNAPPIWGRPILIEQHNPNVAQEPAPAMERAARRQKLIDRISR